MAHWYYNFVENKRDSCEKFRRGSTYRSRGWVRHEAKSAKDGIEGVDHSASCTATSRSKSSNCGRSRDVNHSGYNKQVVEDGECHLAANKMDMQGVFAALPLGAKEEKCSETGTEISSTEATARNIQTDPPRRLFQLSVETAIRANVQSTSASKACSQTEFISDSSQTDDGTISQRSKRCRLSKYGCAVSSDITEHGASHHSVEQFAVSVVGRKGSGTVFVNKSEKKREHMQREKNAQSQVSMNVTKHLQSDCVKGKQNKTARSGFAPEVMEVSRDTRRSSSGHTASASAVVEKRYNLRSSQDSCELPSCNSSSRRGAKKSKVAAQRQNKKKSVVENSSSHEAEAKLYDSEKKSNDNELPQTDSKCKTTANSGRREAADEVWKRDANQTGAMLHHSVRDQNLSSRRNSARGRGRSSARGKPRSSPDDQCNRVHGEASYVRGRRVVRSGHMSADYQLPTSKLKENWAENMDDCHTARGGRVAARRQGRQSALMVQARRFNAREMVATADQHSSFKNSSEKVVEDWEADLFVFPPSEQDMTGMTDAAAPNAKETAKVAVYNSCHAAGDGSTVSADNKAETLLSSTMESVAEDHSDSQDSSSFGQVKIRFDHAAEQIQSEFYDAIAGEKYVIHAEASRAEEPMLLDRDVTTERDIDIPVHSASTATYGKPDTNKYDDRFTDDRKQTVPVPLTGDASNIAEELSMSDEITWPYEIAAEEHPDCLQSEDCSDGISSGK